MTTRTCYCDRDFTVEEMESLLTHMNGNTKIWIDGLIKDNSIESLTRELNLMFRKYSMNKCIQKITFLAQVKQETSFFKISREKEHSAASSKMFYKGRGIMQLTGDTSNDSAGSYKKYMDEQAKGYDLVNNPDLVATDIHLAINSGGWEFSVDKKVEKWNNRDKRDKESQSDYETKMANHKWKRENYTKALGETLAITSLLLEDEEKSTLVNNKSTYKYFYLISRMINGYSPMHTTQYPEFLHYEEREKAFEKLKLWFKYDKDVCKGIKELNFVSGNRTPWMELALSITREMKGCKEGIEPMYSNAKKYLRYCGNNAEPTDGVNGPWCAAFMNWTIGQITNTNTNKPYSHTKSAASLAPLWTDKYKKINEPVFGCIVVYQHSNKVNGHTGFLYGMTKGGKYILLGGNQDNTIRFDVYGEHTSNSKTKKLYGFYIPNDYIIKEEDKLIESDIYDGADDNAITKSINVEYGVITGKSTGQTN